MKNNEDLLKTTQKLFSKALQIAIFLVIIGITLYLAFFISIFFITIFLGLFAFSYLKLKFQKKRKYYKIEDIGQEK